MKFCIEYGDTNFIGLVNPDEYKAFVDEDWELNELLLHFNNEMGNQNILAMQMTNEGIEHSWIVEAKIDENIIAGNYFRKAEGTIRVTTGCLYLVEYTCLTMAAQFQNEVIPDKNCSRYKIDIENGIYKVEVIQYLNVDSDERISSANVELLLNFTKIAVPQIINPEVFWCTYF
jgi:hypothetical protein